MFDHVTIRVADRAASEQFYFTVLPALEIQPTARSDSGTAWGDFSLEPATPERPPTQRLHIGFAAPSREHVDAFWEAGTASGYTDDGPPGGRPQYLPEYYGAFLLDPDGNSAEACHHERLRTDGAIDHLWIRVPDVAAAKAFYASLADEAGLTLAGDDPDRATFRGTSGSFSLVAGLATEHLLLGLRGAGGTPGRTAVDPGGTTVEIVHR